MKNRIGSTIAGLIICLLYFVILSVSWPFWPTGLIFALPAGLLVLYKRCGFVPAVLILVITAGVYHLFAGPLFAGVMTAMLFLPTLMGLILYEKKMPFYHSILATTGVFFCTILLCVSALFLLSGGNFISWVLSIAEDIIHMGGDEMLDALLLVPLSRVGVLEEVTLTIPLDIATRSRLVVQFMRLLEEQIRTLYPGTLLAGCAWGAVLLTWFPRMMARRLGDGSLPYETLDRFYIPRRIQHLLIFFFSGVYLLALAELVAPTVSDAAYALLYAAACMQGLAVCEFLLKARNVHKAVRAVLLLIGLFFLRNVFFMLGVADAILNIRRFTSAMSKRELEQLHDKEDER